MLSNPLNDRAVEASLRALPVSTAILPKLQQMVGDENSDADEIGRLMTLDPGLSSAVIRVSRSALYGGREIESVHEAIARLGFKELFRIVSFYGLAKMSHESLIAYETTPLMFWRKSILCALAMERLSAEDMANTCNGYTVGLLHAMGEVIVDRHLKQQGAHFVQFAYDNAKRLDEQERAVLGMSQSQAAAHAMRVWKMAPSIVEPIEYQFNPEEAPHFSHSALRLRLAKWLTALALGDEARARSIHQSFHFAITIPGNSFLPLAIELRSRLAEIESSVHGTPCAVA